MFFGQYQIMLLSDVCEQLAESRHLATDRSEVEHASSWLQVRRLNHYPPSRTSVIRLVVHDAAEEQLKFGKTRLKRMYNSSCTDEYCSPVSTTEICH